MTLSIQRINPNATILTIGSRTWYFSYQTCVAYWDGTSFAGVDPHKGMIRRQSNYSPTTAKHMSYMGVSEWPKVDDATFERLAGA